MWSHARHPGVRNDAHRQVRYEHHAMVVQDLLRHLRAQLGALGAVELLMQLPVQGIDLGIMVAAVVSGDALDGVGAKEVLGVTRGGAHEGACVHGVPSMSY